MNLKHLMSLLIIGLFLTTACNEEGNAEDQNEMDADSTEMAQDPNAPVPTEVTNEDLIVFMEIMNTLQPAGEAAQREMAAAVESENMTVDQYMAVEQAKMNPEAEISDEDLEKYAKASAKVDKIQADNKAKMEKMIEEQGMTVQKYETILNAVQTNPAMMEQIQRMMMEEQGQGTGAGQQ